TVRGDLFGCFSRDEAGIASYGAVIGLYYRAYGLLHHPARSGSGRIQQSTRTRDTPGAGAEIVQRPRQVDRCIAAILRGRHDLAVHIRDFTGLPRLGAGGSNVWQPSALGDAERSGLLVRLCPSRTRLRITA